MPVQTIVTCDQCKSVVPEGQQPYRILARVILPKGQKMPDTALPFQSVACKKLCAQLLLRALADGIPDPV